MGIIKIFRAQNVISRFQGKANGLWQSALILLGVSFVADLFPLGVLASTSFAWIYARLVLQSITATLLVTWMWIVWNVLMNSLIKRKASSDFAIVKTVLGLTVLAVVILNGIPHPNGSGGRSFGWPFRFLYGLSIVSPFSAILDLAHGLIVVGLLLSIADRAKITSPRLS